MNIKSTSVFDVEIILRLMNWMWNFFHSTQQKTHARVRVGPAVLSNLARSIPAKLDNTFSGRGETGGRADGETALFARGCLQQLSPLLSIAFPVCRIIYL